MLGFIRDEDRGQAEEEFPGIRALYVRCGEKPNTFLDLLARYHEIGECKQRQRASSLEGVSAWVIVWDEPAPRAPDGTQRGKAALHFAAEQRANEVAAAE